MVSAYTSYTTYVHGDGSNYRDAYYEINYVNIYSAQKSTTPGVEGGLPADGPVAGDNDLGRQVTTVSSAITTTASDGATSEVVITTTQNIPDVSDAPSAPASTGASVTATPNSSGSLIRPDLVLSALALGVASLL